MLRAKASDWLPRLGVSSAQETDRCGSGPTANLHHTMKTTFLLIFSAFALGALAQEARVAASAQEQPGRFAKVIIPRLSSAPTIGDFAEMKPATATAQAMR